jgi:hypothetical protein
LIGIRVFKGFGAEKRTLYGPLFAIIPLPPENSLGAMFG